MFGTPWGSGMQRKKDDFKSRWLSAFLILALAQSWLWGQGGEPRLELIRDTLHAKP